LLCDAQVGNVIGNVVVSCCLFNWSCCSVTRPSCGPQGHAKARGNNTEDGSSLEDSVEKDDEDKNSNEEHDSGLK